MKIWAISADKKGMINQCQGLAQRISLDTNLKIVKLNFLQKMLARFFPIFYYKNFFPFKNNFPDLVISAGKEGMLAAYSMKCAMPQILSVCIQDTGSLVGDFDLSIICSHDNPSKYKKHRDKVLEVGLAMHHITEGFMQGEITKFRDKFGISEKKSIAISIGGKAASYHLTTDWVNGFAKMAIRLAKRYRVFISTSRRTGAEYQEMIKTLLSAHKDDIFLMDSHEYNYYNGMLGCSDYIIQTCDSINMISEAIFTKKPLFILKIPGKRKKIERFIAGLEKNRLVKIIDLSISEIDESGLSASGNNDDNLIARDRIIRLFNAKHSR